MKRKSISNSFTGFPIITKFPWDLPPSEEEEEHVVAAREKGKEKEIISSEAGGEKEKDKKEEEVSFFTGFPVTITKLPWELPPTRKKYVLPVGIQIPKFPGQVIHVDETTGREFIYYYDHHPIYNPNSSHNIWHAVPNKKSYPWWHVPAGLHGFDVTFDPAGNKLIRTPYNIKEAADNTTKSPPPPTIVEINPNEYPYTCKPETRDRYYSQLKESENNKEEKMKDKKEISFFTGSPTTITKLPWELLPERKDDVAREGQKYQEISSFSGFPTITKLPWDPPPSTKPPTIVEFNPNEYPYTWKPETHDRYYAGQFKDSEGLKEMETLKRSNLVGRERERKSIYSFTGFPVITKFPWDPIPPSEEEHVAAEETRERDDEKIEIRNVASREREKDKGKEIEMEISSEEQLAGKRKREMHGSSFTTEGENVTTGEKEISFNGFPVITKLPWELPPKKYEPPLEGIEIPKLSGWPEDGQVIYVDKTTGKEDIYHRNYDPTTNWPVRTKSYPWWPVPSLDGSVVTYDPVGNKIRTPYIKEEEDNNNNNNNTTKPPPTIVEIDPNDYTYTCKPEIPDRHRYYAQLEDSEGFDVDPIPGIVPMDHLGAEKKQCELVARMAVDEYNRRYDVVKRIIHSLIWKDDKGEIKFGKIIKVMVKAVSGFIYYITAEAISLSSEMPVTFQAVVVTGASEGEVKTFRFISDSNKVPWLWKE